MFVHSAAAPNSVVRVSTGAASSTASPKPNVPAHGCSPLFCVFLNERFRSRFLVALYVSRKSAMLRFNCKSNREAWPTALKRVLVPFWMPLWIASDTENVPAAGDEYSVAVSRLKNNGI